MNVKIVTDSTCDLPQSTIEDNGISVIPCYINMDGYSYLDGIDITREEFYDRLPACKAPASTSAPGIEMFTKLYHQLAEEGADEIISIHISTNLSNVCNVARISAENFKEIPVTVIDSGQLTLGTGLLVLEAARAAAAGMTAEKITNLVQALAKRIYTFAVVNTFEYLKRSGRVSHLVGGIGEILQVKPILKMHDGVVSMEKIRTRKKAMDRLITLVTSLGLLTNLSVVHTNFMRGADDLIKLLQEALPSITPAYCSQVTPIIGVHIGPGAVGFVVTTE